MSVIKNDQFSSAYKRKEIGKAVYECLEVFEDKMCIKCHLQ